MKCAALHREVIFVNPNPLGGEVGCGSQFPQKILRMGDISMHIWAFIQLLGYNLKGD